MNPAELKRAKRSVRAEVRAMRDAIPPSARARLSAFKVPTLWLVVATPDVVPMSATGKVDKPALQRLLSERGVRCTRS